MGREQKRREQFKNKNKKIKEDELDTSIKGITLVKLVGFVIIFLFVIYYVLAVFVTKEIDISNNGEKSTITESTDTGSSVSNKILASNIFNQKEEEYYVYFYDFNDEDDVVSSVISGMTEDVIYRVDTSSSLNAKYVTEEKGNKSAKSLNDLKVVNPTVIKIEADKIVKYYEGNNEIYKKLK